MRILDRWISVRYAIASTNSAVSSPSAAGS
jgi:hypothetical protein